MKKILLVILLNVLFILNGCGEPTQKEMKEIVTKELKKDNSISKEFIKTLNIKYGNSILVLYNNCPQLTKINNKRLSKEYKEKKKARKGDVWGNLFASAMGDNIWSKSIEFSDNCQRMRYRAKKLLKMIEYVKSVELLE